MSIRVIAFKLQQAPQQNIPDNISTVYATGCTHAFSVLCYFVVTYTIVMDSSKSFTHIGTIT